ncbi:branched-chain amino acid aminotransferase [Actinoplanes couchii]|uniref:Branched-chain-amino-acid aminotransferase n=1 Tax=Actinoplanes couchii TaxID=403638 RepID=A0ABQ3WZN4_9ACTN|nr:branched-chain amino acid aminotransferase [Actinoplanes couchii]MDR6316002.1 branched-chain amino acid aminotransferase [Actinoplanes couchii]GID51615.1 branched-chain-amino-acid aminotransferase [Actinoplanes couchii]
MTATQGIVVRWTASPTADAAREAKLSSPGFGRYFTDHMITATWRTGRGWRDLAIGPLAPFSLQPAALVLHYAQTIFEGLKAYRHDDDSVWLFRPDVNARRFRTSARRLAMPELDETTFVESVAALVRADEPWVPQSTGERTLYLRPFMFATEPFLGYRPATDFRYSVIASPVGSFFADGVQGARLWVSDRFARAGRGGTGAIKCGGNYAAGLAAQKEAEEQGCQQVLHVDPTDGDTVAESGAANLFVVTADGLLVTPELGTILPGVTRDSVLALAAEHGLTAVERRVGLGELRTGCDSGEVVEMFSVGTAAVVTPVLAIQGADFSCRIGTGEPGERSLHIREHLLDIQYGRAADRYGWLHRVC